MLSKGCYQVFCVMNDINIEVFPNKASLKQFRHVYSC